MECESIFILDMQHREGVFAGLGKLFSATKDWQCRHYGSIASLQTFD
jgi:hypothetical protein